MGQETIIMDKIAGLLYEYPEKEFTIREISKNIKIPKSTVQKYLSDLKEKGLADNRNKASNSALFRVKKTNYYIEKIFESGLIEYLEKILRPSCIILFGSFRKGESDKDSDIDIFVETVEKKKVNLELFEKKLKHKIDLFIEKDINDSPQNLKLNIINGIKLAGFARIKT
ncbi:nucleotidyltransferase domain-containing protein [Candidatus Woesearchaeota archaeon]|nr:nucleotidyltransferase domain-containing protein [Candidatus Woesearchaeota archaeon]